MATRRRRAVTDGFKARTVRLVGDSGKSVGVVIRELDPLTTDWLDCVAS